MSQGRKALASEQETCEEDRQCRREVASEQDEPFLAGSHLAGVAGGGGWPCPPGACGERRTKQHLRPRPTTRCLMAAVGARVRGCPPLAMRCCECARARPILELS